MINNANKPPRQHPVHTPQTELVRLAKLRAKRLEQMEAASSSQEKADIAYRIKQLDRRVDMLKGRGAVLSASASTSPPAPAAAADPSDQGATP